MRLRSKGSSQYTLTFYNTSTSTPNPTSDSTRLQTIQTAKENTRKLTSSPKLFIAFLEKVFRKLRWEKNGIKIDSEYPSHLRFANDIIIFASSMEELQEVLHELNQASLEVGLSMNLKVYQGNYVQRVR